MRKLQITFERPRFAHVRVWGWDHDTNDMAWLYIGTINDGEWEYALSGEDASDEERAEAMRRYLE
jgi:hypothetical protein